MDNIISIVRARVGRRHKITRQEMMDIILAIGLPPEASTICSIPAEDGSIGVGDTIVEPVRANDDSLPPSVRPIDAEATARRIQGEIARAWAHACRGITIISVWGGETGCIRYDAPGSIATTHQAEIMFVSSDQVGREYDPIGYLRGHAKRVLIVDADSELQPQPPSPQELREAALCADWQVALVRHLRATLDLDPPMRAILDDGTLQMIDANDNAQTRHQYRVRGEWLQRRHLPAAEIGDCWYGEDSPPEWEDMMPPCGGLIWEYYEAIVA